MKSGECYKYTDEPDDHLWIVLTDPSGGSGEVIVANVTTWRTSPKPDPACVLVQGDHAVINHTSWVWYQAAQIHLDVAIEHAITLGQVKRQGRLIEAAWSRVKKGAIDSDFLADDYKARVRECHPDL